jgi:hypothetical protein
MGGHEIRIVLHDIPSRFAEDLEVAASWVRRSASNALLSRSLV